MDQKTKCPGKQETDWGWLGGQASPPWITSPLGLGESWVLGIDRGNGPWHGPSGAIRNRVLGGPDATWVQRRQLTSQRPNPSTGVKPGEIVPASNVNDGISPPSAP